MKKVVAGIIAALIVGGFGFAHRDQVEARTNCAGKIIQQYTTTSVVPGAYECLTPILKAELTAYYGISNDKDFAKGLGVNGATYSYIGETRDGGYTYEVDIPTAKRSFGDEIKSVWNHITSGDFSGAWDQLNYGTELWTSTVMTVYLFPSGSTSVDVNGNTIDVSGDLLTIQ